MTSAPSPAPSADTVARWRSHIREDALANHALCMGLAIQGSGAPADAIPFLRRALSYSALRAESWFALIQALREAGQPAEAAAAEAEAQREDPGFALAAQVGLAQRWLDTAVIPPDRVLANLREARSLAVGDPVTLARLHLLHLQFLCRHGHMEALAITWADHPPLDMSDDPLVRAEMVTALTGLCRALPRSGHQDIARDMLELALRRLDASALTTGDLILQEVMIAESLNADWDAAIAADLIAVAMAMPAPILASFLSALGQAAIRHGDAAIADRAFTAALSLDPGNRRVRQLQPVHLIFTGAVAEGLAALSQAWADGVLVDLGLRLPTQILLERGDATAALSVLAIALGDGRPAHAELRVLESQIHLVLGDLAAVRARIADPALPAEITRKIAGFLALHEGRWDEADALFAQMRAGVGTPYPDLWRAVARLGAGDWPGLRAALDAADAVRPVPEISRPLRAFAVSEGRAALAAPAARFFVRLACPTLGRRLDGQA